MINLGTYYNYWKTHKSELLKIKEFFPDKVTPHSIERHPIYVALNSTWDLLKETPSNLKINVFIDTLLNNKNFACLPENYRVCVMSALAYQLKQIEEEWYEDVITNTYNKIYSKNENDSLSSIALCYKPYMDAITKRIDSLDTDTVKALQIIKLMFPDFNVLNKTIPFFEAGKNFFINISSASGGNLDLRCSLCSPTQDELYNLYNECYSILLDPPEDYNSRLGYSMIHITVTNDVSLSKPLIDLKYNLWSRRTKLEGHEKFLRMFSAMQSQYKCSKFTSEVIY